MRMPKFLKRHKTKPVGTGEPEPQPEEEREEIEFRTTTELVVKLPTRSVRALVALGVPVERDYGDAPLLRVKRPSLPSDLYGRIQGREAVFRFNGDPKPADVAALKAAQERLDSLPDYAVKLAETLAQAASKIEEWMAETERWKTEVKTLKEDVRRIKEREEVCMR